MLSRQFIIYHSDCIRINLATDKGEMFGVGWGGGSLNEGINSEELLFMSSSFAKKEEVSRTAGL